MAFLWLSLMLLCFLIFCFLALQQVPVPPVTICDLTVPLVMSFRSIPQFLHGSAHVAVTWESFGQPKVWCNCLKTGCAVPFQWGFTHVSTLSCAMAVIRVIWKTEGIAQKSDAKLRPVNFGATLPSFLRSLSLHTWVSPGIRIAFWERRWMCSWLFLFFFLNPKFPYKNLLFPGEKRNLLLLQKKKLEMGKQRAISERRVRRQMTLNIFLLC